jgi:DNA-binding MarR family transcriptional regulator
LTVATRIARRARVDRAPAERDGDSGRTALAPVAAFTRGEASGLLDDGTVRLARGVYQLRRQRDEVFGEELFSEPAWDILLHLYVAGAEGRAVSVSCACSGAAAPATTALRKLRQLEENHWIVRVGDPADARRSYVRLSSKAMKNMHHLLKGAWSSLDERS